MEAEALSNADLTSLVRDLWTLVCAALVLFMQAGFCTLEAGTVRSKNSINVAIKNIIDMCCSVGAFFVVGYALMFGAHWEALGLVGTPTFFLSDLDADELMGFLFQVTFCATAATIVSGAIAERARFLPYLLMSVGIGIAIYPVFGHWVWGGGWLAGLGYHDFAGSSVVHMIGGAVGLAGIQILGARRGRFDDQGRPQTIPASSMPQVALGVIILTVGWIGFNGGSAALGTHTATIVVNTLLAACFGGIVALLVTWALHGLAAVELILNGVLGGLVAITAGADVVSPVSSVVIGMAGGATVVAGTWLLERLRLDDAVGAVPVHLFAGITGILATALFCPATALPEDTSRMAFLGIQGLGAAACVVWGYGTGLLLWWGIGLITPLRIGGNEERVGLNFSEHRVRDPMADLASTLARAARGEAIDEDLRQLEDSDAAAFGVALGTALQRARRSQQDHSHLSRELSDLGATLADNLGSAATSRDQILGQLQELGDYLGRIVAYLDDHRSESSAVPVLIDLLERLGEQLQDCRSAVAAQDSASAHRELGRLQQLARSLVGAAT